MSKQIIIPFQDEKYTLEYTRKSIEKLEQRGVCEEGGRGRHLRSVCGQGDFAPEAG